MCIRDRVKGLSLGVILGNNFLERNKAVIDFNKRIVEFKNGSEPVRVDFKRVRDEIKVTVIKIMHKRVGDGDIETRVNICRESEIVENDERERCMRVMREYGKIGRINFLMRVESVSYTHLDVYKRQNRDTLNTQKHSTPLQNLPSQTTSLKQTTHIKTSTIT